MISFYDWIIQFRNKKSNLGIAGFIIYDDPKFPKDVKTFNELSNYLELNYYYGKSDLNILCDIFNLYLKKVNDNEIKL